MKGSTLTPQQARFAKNIVRGMGKGEAARAAGYSIATANVQASKLLKKVNIQRILDRAGLTDEALASGIKTNIESGMGIKATADTSLRGIELALRLKGHLDKEEKEDGNTTNVYVNNLRNLDMKELNLELNQLNITS